MNESINLDHNATSPLRPEAVQAMQPWLNGRSGNAASAHAGGRAARRALEDARERLAALLGAAADEVVFTSGATEANNLAILGLAATSPGRIVASRLEHPCVTAPLEQLAARGAVVYWMPPNAEGRITADIFRAAIGDDVAMAVVMFANHETGTVQPIAELRSLTGAAFHCDAAQAAGKLPIDFHELGVTTLSISGHKFGGPPGIGALLVNRCARLTPLMFGGPQQRGRRPGTEPVMLAVGMTAALDAALAQREAEQQRQRELRQCFLGGLQAAAPFELNGPESGGLPHVLNISFPGCRGDALLMALDLAGVCCSTGSACSSGSLLPSPVLTAMGLPEARLRSALRFSFGPTTTYAEIDEAARRVVQVVRRLRSLEEVEV